MRVGMENDLPVVNAVDTEGKFIAEVTPWAGVFVKDADPAITADLKDRGLLLGVEPYEHSYPFCWRCDTALLYYAKATWYVRTTAIKDQLIAANDDVDLAPGAHQDRALRRVAGRQRRLGAQPRPLLGHAAAHLALRGGPHALRRLRSRSCGSWRPVPFRRIWNSTGPTSTTSSSPAPSAAARCAASPRSSTPGSTRAPCRSRQWHYPFENVEIVRASASRPTSSARPSTRRAAGSTACSPSPRSSRAAAPTSACSAWGTSSTARARR